MSFPNFPGGKFTYPLPSKDGYIQQSLGAPMYQGPRGVLDMPDFMRVQFAQESLFRIKEGANRVAFTKILMQHALKNGAYVASDVKPMWGVQHDPLPRLYLKVGKQGGATAGTGTAGQTVSRGVFVLEDPAEAKKLQVRDLIVLNFARTSPAKNANSKPLKYKTSKVNNAQATSYTDGIYVIPEVCEIVEVNYTTGAFTADRILTNDGHSNLVAGVIVDVVADDTAFDQVTPNKVLRKDAFIVKIGNSIAELDDDQLIYSTAPTYDYNYVQRVMRKWGAGDMEGKIKKAFNGANGASAPSGNSNNATYNESMRQAIEGFWEEINYLHLYGGRKYSPTPDGRYRGYVGGLLETIPENNIIELVEPIYADFLNKPGSFTIPQINYILNNKYYYGGQVKWLVGGERMMTAWATMINYMTQNVPSIQKEWRVEGNSFKCSNGGILHLVSDDTLSLNGMSDMGVLFDSASYKHGYLGEDAKVIKHPETNPHLQMGEIFIDITSQRINPQANYIFKLTEPA